MDLQLRHLRYALAVAEERNFTRAAARLRVAQPPLSQQIKQLEEFLGARLFERGRRESAMTAAGEAFCREARKILEACASLREQTRRAARGETGRLRIGYVAALSGSFLPRALRHFRARFPEVEIHLADMLESEQVRGLLEGTVDIGFMSVAPSHEPALSSACFSQERLGVLLWKGHASAGQGRVDLRKLAGERLIAIDPAVSPRAFAFLHGVYQKAGLASENLVLARDGQSIVDLVSAGVGVAIVPEVFRPRLGLETVLRPAVQKLPAVPLHYAWQSDNDAPALAAFLLILAQRRSAR